MRKRETYGHKQLSILPHLDIEDNTQKRQSVSH